MVKTIKREFEKQLIELGFSYSSSQDGFYNLCEENGNNRSIKVQLIESISPNKQKYGSKNGNDIQAIGVFIFSRLRVETNPDLFIFTFRNPTKEQPEYLIVPNEKLKRRFLNKTLPGKRVKMVFWLMPDGSTYETTHISLEGEWYFLSKGTNGRMANRTDMEYTRFLNKWQRLKPR